MLMGVIIGGYTSLSAWVLWQRAASITSARVAAALLLLSAGFHVVRGVLTFWPTSVPWIDAFAARWSNELAIAFLLYALVLAFVWLSMAKEKAERELRISAEQVRESEARYRALVAASSSIFWRATPGGAVTECIGWGDFSGQSADDSEASGWLHAVHPADVAEVIDRVQKLASSDEHGEHEYRVRRKDGQYRWVISRFVPVKNRQGSVVEWVGTLADVHDHKLVQDDLARSKERHQLATKATNDALWDWDIANGDVVWNEPIETLFGYLQEDIEPTFDWWERNLHPDDRERVLSSVRTALSGSGTHWSSEFRFRKRDGTYADILDRGYVIRDSDGAPIRMVGAMLDQTARKAAQATLLLRDKALAAIGQGVLITDALQSDNPIIYANPAFERITGYGASEVIGRNCRFLQGEKTDPETIAKIRSALDAGERVNATLLNYKKHGQSFMNELTISPVRDADGKLTHFVGIQSDVSQRIKLEEQLRQSQKMEAIGQLTGGIAHDFNNLLLIILGNAELLQDDSNDAEFTKSLAAMILEAAERGADLTRQLLSFGRRQTLQPEPLRLSDIVENMAPLLRRTIGEHITLRTKLSKDAPPSLTDRTLLESALLNLVVNARDAMPDGGTLTIETGSRIAGPNDGSIPIGQPVVYVTVSDTGVGMSPEVIEHAFEPFFTTKPAGKGSGLGLSMVYGFAQQTGGCVSIESKVGHGSSVSIVLLTTAEKETQGSLDRSVADVRPGRERILVVEDEVQVLQFVTSQLKTLGYDVHSALSGDQGLTLLRDSEHFDLLFTDVVLGGGMSGIELVRHARGIKPNLKVLLTSGYPETVFEHHGRLDFEVKLLPKPYRRADLAEAVQKSLEQD
jgi:PAS domain S-box-containing protein